MWTCINCHFGSLYTLQSFIWVFSSLIHGNCCKIGFRLQMRKLQSLKSSCLCYLKSCRFCCLHLNWSHEFICCDLRFHLQVALLSLSNSLGFHYAGSSILPIPLYVFSLLHRYAWIILQKWDCHYDKLLAVVTWNLEIPSIYWMSLEIEILTLINPKIVLFWYINCLTWGWSFWNELLFIKFPSSSF